MKKEFLLLHWKASWNGRLKNNFGI